MTRASLACLVAPALIGAASPASAQDYPVRPIRVIVTTSPGGLSDVFLRAVGEPCTSGSASRWWSRTAPAAT
jgi:tripartite-type tricarboxylate transporter receptor subunit TctC